MTAMASSLDRTVAIVTGASSGIGQATATKLAAEGATVVAVARRADRLVALIAEIERRGGRAFAFTADITQSSAAADAVDFAMAELGRLDTLVNAAGLMLNGPSISSPVDEWERMVDVNLKGLMFITKFALPHLVATAAKSDRDVTDVVNISSIAGRAARATVAIYNATKFGVTAATEAWRQEFTRQNVRFSVIEPGAVDTELFGHGQAATQENYERMFAEVEKLHAEDIAEAVAYIVTSPRRVAINEIVIRPTDQT